MHICPTTGKLYVPAEIRDEDGVQWARCRCCDAVGGRLGRRRQRLNPKKPQWHPIGLTRPSLPILVSLAVTLPGRQLAI